MVEALPILIVDEDPALVVMLRRFLTRQGIDVYTAARVAEARTLLAQYTFQVVSIDLFWPANDGLRLVRHVREVAPRSRVIVMAAFPDLETRQHAIAEGADVCLDKPFRLRQLWDTVQKVVGAGHTGGLLYPGWPGCT